MLKLLKKKADPKVGPDYLVLNLGPHHSGAARGLRVVVQLDGETVIRCVPQCGYRHGGFEKLAESTSATGLLDHIDRTGWMAAPATQIAIASAFEAAIGVTIPERAAFVRMLAAELERIAGHLSNTSALARDLGVDRVAVRVARASNAVASTIRELSEGGGHAFVRLGGVARDLPEGITSRIDDALRQTERAIGLAESGLGNTRTFGLRTRGIGAYSMQDVADFSLSGPVLRACGLMEDVRTYASYLAYGQVSFDVPIGSEGDARDRFRVRLAEIRQSLRIVRSVLTDIPPGAVREDVAPDPVLPEGETYRAVEAPGGELGCLLVGSGEPRPRRLRLRTPSQFHFRSMSARAVDHRLADVIPFLTSLDIRIEELDR